MALIYEIVGGALLGNDFYKGSSGTVIKKPHCNATLWTPNRLSLCNIPKFLVKESKKYHDNQVLLTRSFEWLLLRSLFQKKGTPILFTEIGEQPNPQSFKVSHLASYEVSQKKIECSLKILSWLITNNWLASLCLRKYKESLTKAHWTIHYC